MNKQEKSEQKASNGIPQNVIEFVERLLEQKITSAEFKRGYVRRIGKKKCQIRVFIVNNSYYVHLFDDNKKFYKYQSINSVEEYKKEYGNRVHMLMEKTHVTWEMGKLVAQYFRNDSDAIRICQKLNSARERVLHEKDIWNEKFKISEAAAVKRLLQYYDIDEFNLRNPYNLKVLKKYLFTK